MSQFYFATFTSTNSNMVTLATLLTATTFKTESISVTIFKNVDKTAKKRKPDNIHNLQQMTLSTKFNLKLSTLQKSSSTKTTRNIAFIHQDQRRKKI
jgi:hypothetical protein